MKTTAKTLVGCIALALVLSSRTVTAALLCGVPETMLAAAALGQSGSATMPTDDPQKQTADLLQRARRAMAENDLVAADTLVARAEALGVKQNIFYRGDTAEKARRDLDRMRTGNSPTKSGGLLSPLGGNRNKQAPATDPFAGRQVGAGADGGYQQVTPLPRIDAAIPVSTPTDNRVAMLPPAGQGYPATGVEQNELRMNGVMSRELSNDNPLRKARLALAVGDVRQAASFVQQARNMRANYQPSDDNPDKVEAAIRKHQELQGLDKNTEAYARMCSQSLVQQAEGLVRWGDYDEAERLGSRAAALKIAYGPFEQKPQELLQRIATARRQAGAAAPAWPNAPGYADASATAPGMATRQQAVQMVRQAREAIAAGQLDQAEAIARRAGQMRLPDSAFAPGEDRPELVLLDLQQLRRQTPSAVVPAGGQYAGQPAGYGEANRYATRAVYDPGNDPTRNARASNDQPGYPSSSQYGQTGSRYGVSPYTAQPPAPPQPDSPTIVPTPSPNSAQPQGMGLFQQGEAAMKANDPTRAYELFRQAATHTNELDPVTAQRLQDHLQLLSAGGRTRTPPPAGPGSAMGDQVATQQQLLIRQIAAELAHRTSNALAKRASDPKAALAMLEDARKRVETAGLDTTSRDQLLRNVDRTIAETKQVIEQNRPQIELAEKNNRIRQDVERSQRMKIEVQEKLALKIDQFNRLIDEQRFAEAEKVAKEADQLSPNDPVVRQVLIQGKFLRRFQEAKDIESQKEDMFVRTMDNVDRASISFDDNQPMVFPSDVREWKALTHRRQKFAGDRQRARSPRELDIEKKLRTPVSMQFTDAPLTEVTSYLAKLADVNLVLDPKGLAEEGVTSDTRVTMNLTSDIMLKSVLNLILEPLHLSYVIKDDVLKITSEGMRDVQTYTVTYNVADLVIPIPNFVPTSQMGLSGAVTQAMNNVGGFGSTAFASTTATPLSVVTSSSRRPMANNPEILAQQVGTGGHTAPTATQKFTPNGGGPGGLGGGAQPDFDSLIDLITSTIKPTTWDTVGAPGSIKEFETNLSIVVSQTQEVHEEIVQLLEQLRRLQDLQVTIEVRFITLNDNFFERIGVDFDFDIKDNLFGKGVSFDTRSAPASAAAQATGAFQNPSGIPPVTTNSSRAVTVGMSQPGVFSADLDVPMTQGNYTLAVPQFGGFDASAGAELGFAILSDVEAYFFIKAAQGDKRSNVLQAPKVTLFNGQQAFVSDTSQSPFVISVVPVVGDFAAAQQPVIVVLSEGTFMTVQAVVSPDRRFVRLTVVPFFSKIGEVNTFQFTGSTTSSTDSTREGLRPKAKNTSKLWNNTSDSNTTTSSGVVVQLPTFSFVTVTTTVSVPDGGTVLLGGIKRLSEGRNEFGVPLLNKLPYINRLFKDVGIGRETQSLMMMVTPRIIIQEEEELKMGIEEATP